MFQYNTISSELGEIKLSTLYFPNEPKKFDMCSLTFFIDDVEVTYWDNEIFIFGEFRDFLYRWVNQDLKVEDKATFAAVWDYLEHGEFAEELIEMLETAIAQGWYIKAVQ